MDRAITNAQEKIETAWCDLVTDSSRKVIERFRPLHNRLFSTESLIVLPEGDVRYLYDFLDGGKAHANTKVTKQHSGASAFNVWHKRRIEGKSRYETVGWWRITDT